MLILKRPAWPVRLARIVFYFFYNSVKFFSYRFKEPAGDASKVVVLNKHGQVLLTKIGYAHKSWVIPGGSVDKGETQEAAATRELEEETGIEVEAVEFMFMRPHEKYPGVKLYNYFVEVDDPNITIDTMEIVDAGWFDLDNLPEPHRPKLPKEIELFKEWKSKRGAT